MTHEPPHPALSPKGGEGGMVWEMIISFRRPFSHELQVVISFRGDGISFREVSSDEDEVFTCEVEDIADAREDTSDKSEEVLEGLKIWIGL